MPWLLCTVHSRVCNSWVLRALHWQQGLIFDSVSIVHLKVHICLMVLERLYGVVWLCLWSLLKKMSANDCLIGLTDLKFLMSLDPCIHGRRIYQPRSGSRAVSSRTAETLFLNCYFFQQLLNVCPKVKVVYLLPKWWQCFLKCHVEK